MGHICLNSYKQYLTGDTQVYESIHLCFEKVRHPAAFKTQISTASCHRAGRHYRVHPERGGGALPGQDAGGESGDGTDGVGITPGVRDWT